LNEAKIINLYAGTVERAEEQIKVTTANEVSGKGSAKVALGEHARSQEVVQKLLPVQKLQIVRAALEKEGELVVFNGDNPRAIARLTEQTRYIVVQTCFKVQGLSDKDPTAWQRMLLPEKPKPFALVGQLTECKIRMLTSSNSFISLTVFPRFILLSQAPKGIPLEVIGVAIAVSDASKTLEVDPIAMYYKGKAAF
jgi:hypothetical protein